MREAPKGPDELVTKEEESTAQKGNYQMPNQNPNSHHNTKKEALGPNTRR